MKLTIRLSERTPLTEQRLFQYGVNDTSKGDFILTRTGAQEVMARHRNHGVDLMLDFEHHSLDPNSTPEQKKASGWGDLELRDDGIHLVNIRWTPQASEYLKNAEYRYLSPAFNVNDDNEITELINVALTNLPATHDQLPLVAANRITKESSMKKHLQAAMEKHGGMEGLSKLLGWDSAKCSKHLGGEPMTQEEMKHCALKMELSDADMEASMNGLDVNKTSGSESDGTLSGLFATGQEAEIPHNSQEADENQKGELHLSRADVSQLLEDRKTIVELKQTIETAQRDQLISANRSKLNPRLIALARRMPVRDMKEFIEALPTTVELNEPQPTGASRMVTLTREEKEVAKLSGKSEKEFAEMKESIGDERLIALAGNVGPKADKAPQTNWDRRYAEHLMSLSMTDMTTDGKPWKPAPGSKFSPASKLA